MPVTSRCLACVGRMGRAFGCLPDDLARQLASATVPVGYRHGQVIFQQGTVALAAYCIRSGSVRLSRRWMNGHEVVVGTRVPGELVGVRALLAQLPYGTSAEAIEPSTVCVIPRETFLELVRQSHELALALLQWVATDSRLTEDLVVARAGEDVPARTARLLITLALTAARPNAAPVIAMSRERMTLLVGTTRETLSRTLHGLAHRSMIEIQGNTIRVLDLPALRSLIE